MEILKAIIYILILVMIFSYTLSYGMYELKNENTTGAVGVFIICAFLIAVPIFVAVFNR